MLLGSQLALSNPTAVVTLLPPGDALPEALGVNLYLYRVSESPHLKNEPWAGDRLTPPKPHPALSLQLSYLMTPLGIRPSEGTFDAGDDAHTMLGIAMRTLHENPILNNVHITGFDADVVLPDFLQNSFEQVKVTLVPTTLDELSKIWSTINKPYRLSVAYEVSIVQIAPTPPVEAGGGIVLSTGLQVITLDPPRPSTLIPEGGPIATAAGGALAPLSLRIDGFGMAFPGQTPVVRVGGQPVTIAIVPPPTGESLTVTMPASPTAGPQVDVTVALNGRRSVPLVFQVSPWIASATPVRTAIEGPSPKLTLTGNGFTATPQAVRFELTSTPPPGPPIATLVTVTAFDAGGSDTRALVAIPAALVSGTYNVRLVLADAASSASNARSLEVIPLIDSPVGVAEVNVDLKQVHRITFNGARLNGQDVRVLIDGVLHQTGANVNAAQMIFTAGRLLAAGAHQVAVQVDGHRSHEFSLTI